ncbi:ATP-binding cassette domain-containing protein [Chitinophaga sp. NPDC101104]|uniref:ATP-binding cassette domain-containing protein n=1 Tax=Chitinophaga sp. NPDC101104 TaxID=3390561 RepID=UPI003D087ED6
MSSHSLPFLSMDHITVRNQQFTLLKEFTWHVNTGEHWAIVGRSGAGKTSLLHTIIGKNNVIGGSIRHYFYERYREAHPIDDPYFNYRRLVAMVGRHNDFRNKSNMPDFYYQQRFNSMDAEDAPTVDEYLENRSEDPLLAPLSIGPLRHKALIKLSNGETRRVMIARALLRQPALLLLDNPFIGLDVAARQAFHGIVDHLAASGVAVVLVTTPQEIPAAITHVLELEGGRIAGSWTRSEFLAQYRPEAPEAAATAMDAGLVASLTESAPKYDFTSIVQMENIHVKYGENVILDGIDWHVRSGEKWALLGPNGSGKSTLLSLITADNPQSYANRIVLFDRKRGSGESIWDIKRKIGFVSPELHQYFKSDATCLQVAASGFYDTIGYMRPATPEQLETAGKWLQVLECRNYTGELFKNVPAGIQRLVLLARALVKNPPLLIFDEPTQGLDDHQRNHFKKIIEMLCEHMNVTMIYVTHYEEELPAPVNRFLRIRSGKMI